MKKTIIILAILLRILNISGGDVSFIANWDGIFFNDSVVVANQQNNYQTFQVNNSWKLDTRDIYFQPGVYSINVRDVISSITISPEPIFKDIYQNPNGQIICDCKYLPNTISFQVNNNDPITSLTTFKDFQYRSTKPISLANSQFNFSILIGTVTKWAGYIGIIQGPIINNITQLPELNLLRTNGNYFTNNGVLTISINVTRGSSSQYMYTKEYNSSTSVDFPFFTNFSCKIQVSVAGSPNFTYSIDPTISNVSINNLTLTKGYLIVHGFGLNLKTFPLSDPLTSDLINSNVTVTLGQLSIGSSYLDNIDGTYTQLKITLPSGVTTELVEPCKLTIVIDGAQGSSQLLYVSMPSITNVSGKDGTFTITGVNLVYPLNQTTIIQMNGYNSTITMNDPTSSTVTFPQDLWSGNGFTLFYDQYRNASWNGNISLTPSINTFDTPIPTSGQTITLKGKYMSSNFTVSRNGANVHCNFYNGTTMTCDIGPGTGQHNQKLDVTFDGTSYDNIIINYLPPTITSVTYAPQLDGTPRVTIQGSNFGTNKEVVEVLFDNNPSTFNIDTLTDSRIEFPITQSTSGASVSVIVDGQSSSSLTLSLTKKLASISSPLTNGGIVTITGSFFGDLSKKPNQVNITLKGNRCDFLGINSGRTSIFCRIGAGTGQTNLPGVYISNQQVENNNISFSYMAPYIQQIISNVNTKNGGVVSIFGRSLGDSSITVTVGGIKCTEPRTSQSTLITCILPSIVDAPNPDGYNVSLVVDTIPAVNNDEFQVFYILSTDTNSGDNQITSQNQRNAVILPCMVVSILIIFFIFVYFYNRTCCTRYLIWCPHVYLQWYQFFDPLLEDYLIREKEKIDKRMYDD